MKKTALFVASLALLATGITSCSKEESQNNDSQRIAFTGTFDNAEMYSSKTVLSGTRILWEEGDEIAVVGMTGWPYWCRANQFGGTYTTFSYSHPFQDGIEPTPPYMAIYPARLMSDDEMWMPDVQHSQHGELHDMPMYAYSEDMNFEFTNLCSVLRLDVRGDYARQVTDIEVTTDQFICGPIDETFEDDLPTITFSSGSRTINLEIADPESGDGIYNICMPPTTYHTFHIVMTARNGYVYTKDINLPNGLTLARNHIQPIVFSAPEFVEPVE